MCRLSFVPADMPALLDIEGTVCSISFVKDVLYPYFLQEYPALLAKAFPLNESDPIGKVLLGFPTEVTASYDSVVSHINHLVASDFKDPVLKAFQGIVWKMGYDSGKLKAPLYADAIDFVKTHSPVYIYSSGSVPAQKLLFAHVDVDGSLADLTSYILGYFDITTSGYKQDAQSYVNIAKSIGCDPLEVVFYSDNANEVRAALAAGMASKVVVRPGNAPLTDEDRQLEAITEF